MTRRFFGFLGALAGLSLVSGSCVDDPLANLDGAPADLLVSHTALQLTQGALPTIVTATVVDGRSTPLAVPITFAPCNAALSIAPSSSQPVPATTLKLDVRGVGLALSCFDVSGAGFTKRVEAVVLPGAFAGALSAVTAQGGDTITISSTAELKFDTALVGVTFGPAPAAAATILAKTPDQLRVLVPFSSPGPLTISGINVTYVTGLRATLPTTSSFTQTGNRWAASSSWQTAPDISGLLPAAASTSRMIVTRTNINNVAVCPEGFGSTGPCNFFRFTVPATSTYNFTIDWEGTAGDPDVDIYHCNDSTVANFGTACFITGTSGATGAKPQTTGADSYAAGTYWFVIEIFAGSGPRNAFVSISRP